MESDSVFHNLLVCMELLPVLQAVFAIPNMNALPVHCANQVSKFDENLAVAKGMRRVCEG